MKADPPTPPQPGGHKLLPPPLPTVPGPKVIGRAATSGHLPPTIPSQQGKKQVVNTGSDVSVPEFKLPNSGLTRTVGIKPKIQEFGKKGKELPGQLKPGKKVENLPQPKPFQPFGPKRPRLPLLGQPDKLGQTPVPTKEQLKTFRKYINKVIDPQNTLDLVKGRSRLVILKETPERIQVSDEEIATWSLIEPKQLTILGREVGTTVMNLWFKDPKDKTKEAILSYLVRVLPDPEEKLRLERIYEGLSREINRLFPDSYVELKLIGDKIVVRGEAKDVAEAAQILRIVRANAPEEDEPQVPIPNLNVNLIPGDPTAPTATPGLKDFILDPGRNVINLLRIPGEHQVMLKVTVAEVNRAAARSIGLNFSITNNQGVNVFSNNTGQIGFGGTPFNFGGGGAGAGLGGAGGLGAAAAGLGGANLPVALDNGQINLAINALRTMSYARSLAEPNLTVLNGQTGTFLAGGQFPVPVTTGATLTGLQGVEFVPFGVQLAFTPIITDRSRIRLTMTATVSSRDLAAGAQIGGANIAGLNTRTFATVVELRDGETLAVAGLIQNNLGADASRVPFIGDLPILNHLTGLDRISSGEQELVVLVTPVLVHPLNHKELPPLPGTDIFEPGDLEFYLLGRLESRRAYDYRSSVMTDIDRMRSYHRCERYYIFGPSGHSAMPR